MNPPVLDLLRERREELGQISISPFLADRRPLMRNGMLIGITLLGVALGASLLLYLRQLTVRAELAQLETIETQRDRLQVELGGRQAAVRKLVATNRKLVESLTSVRTTSALLSELQLRTPDGVQLLAVEVQGPTLVLKGRATDPLAFSRINALQLQLKRSELLEPAEVLIKKVQRQPEQEATATPKGVVLARAPQPVDFEIRGPFASLDPVQQLNLLRSLGSNGMASRLELLQKEGLLP